MLRDSFKANIRSVSAWFRTGSGLGLLFMFLAGKGLLAPCTGLAQERFENFRSAESNEKPAATLTIQVNEVDLSFLATDSHHHWITDLSEGELRLLDNGKSPESIRLFQSRTGLPLRVGLLVDTSGSVAQQFAFEKKAAALFISQIVDPAKDLAFVLGFNNRVALTQDFTDDTEALASAVYRLHPDGATAVYDAINFACAKLMQHPEEGLSRRVLVLLTDGQDNNSYLTPEQLIENVMRCNAVVVVLHTESEPNESSTDYKALKKLTSETGGQIFRASNKKQMTKAFDQLSEELRSYYLLAYRPAQFNADGSYRKIKLKTTRRGTHIISRQGYYASR
jgi:Ca-activated chloride channel homolog